MTTITIHPPLLRLLAARSRDRPGDRIHIALALAYCFFLPVDALPMDVAFGLLGLWSLIRLRHTSVAILDLLRQPPVILCILWTLWYAIALLWSADRAQGLDELRAFRALLAPLFLWPVIDRAHLLLPAFLLGVFAQNSVQLLQALGVMPQSHDLNLRIRGLLHPIQTGALCAASLCLHASAILHAAGRLRIFSIFGFLAAAAGLLATGSRGPWLCAAIALPLALLLIALRRPHLRKYIAVLCVFSLLAAAAAYPLAAPIISRRVVNFRDDYTRAAASNDLLSDIGIRLNLWSWAFQIYRCHPALGVGAGSFELAARELPQAQHVFSLPLKKQNSVFRAHAHSTPLHTLATLGSVGGALLLAAILLTLRASLLPTSPHPWADGMFPALLTWVIGSQFDCYHLNGHYLGLFALLLALASAHVLLPPAPSSPSDSPRA